MMINTKYRTNQSEIMDDFDMKGDILRDALDKIAKINQLLGGNKLTLEGIKTIINTNKLPDIITVVDVGCGNGDMLRKLADYGRKNNIAFELIGIDANIFTIEYARKLSVDYANISYRCEDVFGEQFQQLKYDIVLCTLTLHHFLDNDIRSLLKVFQEKAKLGMVINDLQRSAISYRLFQGLCFVFRLNAMSRKDGLVSILRGFKKKELEAFSKQLNFKKYTIEWKWAFRYQWIIKNEQEFEIRKKKTDLYSFNFLFI